VARCARPLLTSSSPTRADLSLWPYRTRLSLPEMDVSEVNRSASPRVRNLGLAGLRHGQAPSLRANARPRLWVRPALGVIWHSRGSSWSRSFLACGSA
jgi:hypothetical protein